MNYDDQNIFRANCIELSSKTLNLKYEEYPILYVDNLLKGEEKKEYERYMMYGRGGAPSWKDYYAIKNLAETLEEIGGLENPGVFKILETVNKSFLRKLFKRIQVDRQELRNPEREDIFIILQKLEFFYPEKNQLIQFLLRVDNKELDKDFLEEVMKEYEETFEEESYFLSEERCLMEVMLLYLRKMEDEYQKKMEGLEGMKDKLRMEKLIEFLAGVAIR